MDKTTKCDYTINPCNSVINFLKKNNELGPNETNNLCYQVCKDWTGSDEIVEGTECYNNCKQCTLPFIYNRGKDVCSLDYKVPPIWNNLVSYFPELYRETNDKKISLKKCKEKCDKHMNGSIECKNLCELDMDAIVYNKDDRLEKIYNFSNERDMNTNTNFIILFIIFTLIISFMIYIIFI